MNFVKVFKIVVIAIILPVCATGAEYYVSLTGDDANDGSSGHPFRSPCHALSKAKANDTVYFYAGEYNLTNTPQVKANYITLKGLGTTRADVVFNAGGQRRCLDIGFPDSGSSRQYYVRVGTTLSGITFKNGYLNQNNGGYNNWGFDFGAGVRLANIYGNSTSVDSSVITNCAFIACTNMLSYGGAVNCAGGAKFIDCLFKDNYAGAGLGNGGESGGGALLLQPAGADVTIENCTFENNVAKNGYSAIAAGSYNGACDQNDYCVRVKNSTFKGNRGQNHTTSERACPLLGAKVREAVGCTFISNRTEKLSTGAVKGAIMTLATDSTWTNRFDTCTFEGNHSDGAGGCFSFGALVHPCLTNCTFTGNTSYNSGSAIFCATAGNNEYSVVPLVVENCTFTGNKTLCDSDYKQCAVMTVGIHSRVVRSTFTANETSGWCGVLYAQANTNLLVDACTFTANVIKPQASGTPSGHSGIVLVGGVTGVSYGMPEVRNCLFACNTNLATATKGHVVFLRGYYARVHNSTFVGNRSAESDAAAYSVFLFNAAGYEVRNCLFADNHILDSNVSNNGFNRSEFVRKCAEDGDSLNVNTEWALNIRNATMFFMDAANGDYRPTKKTPGRDLGLTFDWMAGTKDRSGETDRIVNEVPDFGCYEWIRILRGLTVIVR